MRDDTVYLRHIAESIGLIEQYLAEAGGEPDQNQFYEDRRTQDAVLRRLETLADAAGRLSDALKQRHAGIRWRQIGGFRNMLAHGYTNIRLDEMWLAITADLPALRAVVARELNDAPSQ